MTNIKPETLGFLDNPQAPEVFADALTGAAFLQNNIKLTFESLRVNYVSTPGPTTRVVIGTLVLPIAAAENLK
jgi:hypothetical protein